MKTAVLSILAAAAIVGGIAYYRSRPQFVPIELGVPLYPGSITDKDSFAARLSPRDKARLVKAVTYRTDDPPAKVIGFYKEQLKGKTQVLETTKQGIPSAVFQTQIDGKPKFIMITYNEDSQKTQILISTIAPPR
ncbi:MAG TPA: hypothetical protein VE398_14260 [Acidobacteriota bacterium]|nr:hypothetical protein [Acidobacteriota bacterium]